MSEPSQKAERAKAAAEKVSRLSTVRRLAYLGNLRRVILRRQSEILDQIQGETGKSRLDGFIAEIFSVLDNIHYLEKKAEALLSDEKVSTPVALLGKSSRIFYEPLGWVLVISPWNYPFYLALVPSLYAFVAGNAVVVKPSEWTPLTGLLESLLEEAAFPQDGIQVAYGKGEVGEALIRERPGRILFTGSVKTGRKVAALAGESLIPVDLELGGKDPMIVFEDANVDRAVAGALWGAFTTSGQSCTSVERCYVHESLYDSFRSRLVEKTRSLKLGVDKDGSCDIGPMSTKFQVETVERHLRQALQKGAKQWTGEEWDGKNPLIPPIVLDSVPEECDVLNEETFGPLLPLIPFKDEAQVVSLANASDYGLSASVWTSNKEKALRVARALEVGNVSVNNVMLTEGNPSLPFGGVKNSGVGRTKGAWGLRSFCRMKSVLVDGDSAKIEANWFPYTPEKLRLFTEVAKNLFGEGLGKGLRFLRYAVQLEKYSDRIGKK